MADRVGIKTFAEMAGYSIEYARQLMREGKGPKHMRMGRRYVFFLADIEQWILDHTVEP